MIKRKPNGSGIWREEFSRAFWNGRFLAVFLLSLACFAYGLYDAGRFFPGLAMGAEAPVTNNAYELWLFVHFRSYFIYLAPIAAALPFADSLWVDRSQGFLRFILVRTSYRQYLTAKLMANLAAGAAAVGSPLLLLFLFTSLSAQRTPPVNSLVFTTWGAQNGSPAGVLSSWYPAQPDLYILALIGLACLFGAVFATFGLAISGLVHNRYVILAAPFMLFMVSSYISDRAQHLGRHWSPETLIIPYNTTGVTAITLLVQLTVLVLISGLLLYFFGRRERIVQ